MKSAKSLYFALLAVALLVAGNVTVRARTTQQTVDQAKGDSSTTAKSGKKNTDSSATPKKNGSKSSTASTAAAAPVSKPSAAPSAALGSTAPASKPTSAQQQTPPVNSAGLVWVSTDSGVYHQPDHTLVWKNQTREVQDRSRRPKGQLSRGGSGCAEKEIELVDLCVASSRLPQVLIFSLLLFSQDDFAVAHELIVQPQTVLVRGRFATGARRAAEQPHAGRRLKNVR